MKKIYFVSVILFATMACKKTPIISNTSEPTVVSFVADCGSILEQTKIVDVTEGTVGGGSKTHTFEWEAEDEVAVYAYNFVSGGSDNCLCPLGTFVAADGGPTTQFYGMVDDVNANAKKLYMLYPASMVGDYVKNPVSNGYQIKVNMPNVQDGENPINYSVFVANQATFDPQTKTVVTAPKFTMGTAITYFNVQNNSGKAISKIYIEAENIKNPWGQIMFRTMTSQVACYDRGTLADLTLQKNDGNIVNAKQTKLVWFASRHLEIQTSGTPSYLHFTLSAQEEGVEYEVKKSFKLTAGEQANKMWRLSGALAVEDSDWIVK